MIIQKNLPANLRTALATLKKRSIVIYRLYNKAYALWEGSDIDIEAKLREAERHIDMHRVLSPADLSHYLPTRPLVARRHLFETGTLRYFVVRYTDLENFDADLEECLLTDADGLVLYVTADKRIRSQAAKRKGEQHQTHRSRRGIDCNPTRGWYATRHCYTTRQSTLGF